MKNRILQHILSKAICTAHNKADNKILIACMEGVMEDLDIDYDSLLKDSKNISDTRIGKSIIVPLLETVDVLNTAVDIKKGKLMLENTIIEDLDETSFTLAMEAADSNLLGDAIGVMLSDLLEKDVPEAKDLAKQIIEIEKNYQDSQKEEEVGSSDEFATDLEDEDMDEKDENDSDGNSDDNDSGDDNKSGDKDNSAEDNDESSDNNDSSNDNPFGDSDKGSDESSEDSSSGESKDEEESKDVNPFDTDDSEDKKESNKNGNENFVTKDLSNLKVVVPGLEKCILQQSRELSYSTNPFKNLKNGALLEYSLHATESIFVPVLEDTRVMYGIESSEYVNKVSLFKNTTKTTLEAVTLLGITMGFLGYELNNTKIRFPQHR